MSPGAPGARSSGCWRSRRCRDRWVGGGRPRVPGSLPLGCPFEFQCRPCMLRSAQEVGRPGRFGSKSPFVVLLAGLWLAPGCFAPEILPARQVDRYAGHCGTVSAKFSPALRPHLEGSGTKFPLPQITRGYRFIAFKPPSRGRGVSWLSRRGSPKAWLRAATLAGPVVNPTFLPTRPGRRKAFRVSFLSYFGRIFSSCVRLQLVEAGAVACPVRVGPRFGRRGRLPHADKRGRLSHYGSLATHTVPMRPVTATGSRNT